MYTSCVEYYKKCFVIMILHGTYYSIVLFVKLRFVISDYMSA